MTSPLNRRMADYYLLNARAEIHEARRHADNPDFSARIRAIGMAFSFLRQALRFGDPEDPRAVTDAEVDTSLRALERMYGDEAQPLGDTAQPLGETVEP